MVSPKRDLAFSQTSRREGYPQPPGTSQSHTRNRFAGATGSSNNIFQFKDNFMQGKTHHKSSASLFSSEASKMQYDKLLSINNDIFKTAKRLTQVETDEEETQISNQKTEKSLRRMNEIQKQIYLLKNYATKNRDISHWNNCTKL